jgi:hypothetical protein
MRGDVHTDHWRKFLTTLIHHARALRLAGPVRSHPVAMVLSTELALLVASARCPHAAVAPFGAARRRAVRLATVVIRAQAEHLSTEPAPSLTKAVDHRLVPASAAGTCLRGGPQAGSSRRHSLRTRRLSKARATNPGLHSFRIRSSIYPILATSASFRPTNLKLAG